MSDSETKSGKGKLASRAASLGCLILFALPFAGVGVFMAYRMVVFTAEWIDMRSWDRVEARIVSTDLHSSRGDDSTSYEARARYTYVYGGREYSGTRVALHTGLDSVGSFQENTYRELSGARGQPVSCWVDPSDPSKSVLYPGLRWEMVGFHLLFVILFGGVGFGLIAAGAFGSKTLKADDALRESHPGEPWLHHQEWASGRITSSTKAKMWTSVGFASFWLLVSSPTVFIVYQALKGEEEPVALIAAVFPIAGIALGYWAVTNVARYRKFGESVLELHTIPGVIGGPVSGTVKTRAFEHVQGTFDATLSCVRRRRTSRGKNRSTSENVIWQRRRRFAYDRARGGLYVSFHVPYDAEPSDEEDPNNRLTWKLSVDGKAKGVDYHSEFELPVFKTEHSSPEPLDPSSFEEETAVVDTPLAERLGECGGRVDHRPSGTRYVFPMARQPGVALMISGFFLGWMGIVVALFYSDAPSIFAWVFGFFGLLLLFGALDMWLHASQVEVRPGQLTFASGWFGGKTRTFPAADVRKLKPKRGMQSGNKLFYRLEVLARDGKSHLLAKGLVDLDTAERLGREIESTLRAGA